MNGTDAPSPLPSGAGSRGRRPHRAPSPIPGVALAVLVAVLVVVAAFFVAGLGPFRRTPPTSAPAPSLTFAEAEAVANATESNVSGGPWSPFFALGADFDVAGTLPWSQVFNASLFAGGGLIACTGTIVAPSTTVLVPEFSGALSRGTAPAWFLFAGNHDTLLLTAVLGATATVWERYTGAGCARYTGASNFAIPANVVDSPTALAAVLSGGGSTFLSEHPGGSLYYAIVGGALLASGTSAWSITDSTCPAAGSPSTTSRYWSMYANVSATSGTLVGAVTSGLADCSRFSPISAPPAPLPS